MLRCREAVIPRYRSATRSTRQRLAQPLSINKEDIVGLAVDQGDRNFIPVLRQQVRIRRDVDFLNAYGALCGDGVDDLAGSVTQVTTRAGEQRDASGSHGRRNLLLVTTLNAGLLQQFAVLLLRHALAPLLDDRTHWDFLASLVVGGVRRGSAGTGEEPIHSAQAVSMKALPR